MAQSVHPVKTTSITPAPIDVLVGQLYQISHLTGFKNLGDKIFGGCNEQYAFNELVEVRKDGRMIVTINLQRLPL